MQQIKDFLELIKDILAGTVWSYSIFEIIPLIPLFPVILAGETDFSFLGNTSVLVNVLVALAGLVYLILRIVHFWRMSSLNIRFRKEEIIEKENSNFYRKFNKEFIDQFNKEKDGNK